MQEKSQVRLVISFLCGGSVFGRAWGNPWLLDFHTTCLAPVALASPDSWFWCRLQTSRSWIAR